jgi:hypothetical protein
MQIKNLQATIQYLSRHMLNVNDSSDVTTNERSSSSSPSTTTHTSVQVNPIVIKKTPKFPSRDRHLAIRRKKVINSLNSSPTESEKSEIFSFNESSSRSSSSERDCNTSEFHEE